MAQRRAIESPLPRVEARVSGTRRRALSVLVVEDDVTVGNCIAEVLIEAGHTVTTVRTLRDARLYLSVEYPAVLALDVQLDGELGTELLDDLRDLPHAPSLVIVSASRLAECVAQENGALFVRKPFDIEALIAAVRSAASGPNGEEA